MREIINTKGENKPTYETVLRLLNENFTWLNSDWKYLEQSPAHQTLTGYSDLELIGNTPDLLFGINQFSEIKKALEKNESFQKVAEIDCRNGKKLKIILQAASIPVEDNDKKIYLQLRLLANESDLNEYLKLSEHKYRQLIENSLQGIVILQDLKIVYTNPAFTRMSGYSYDELLSLNLKQILSLAHKDDRKLMWDNYNRRIKGLKVPPHYKFRLICKDGKIKVLDIYANLTEYGGKPAIQGFLLDVTAEFEAREALIKSEQNYRFLIENQTDFLTEMDYEWKFTFVSPSYSKLIGIAEDQLLHKPFFDFIVEESRKTASEIMKSLDIPPYTCYVEHKVLAVNGIRWIAWQHKSVIDENGEITSIVSSGRDITDLKVYEVNLRNRNKYIETILNNLPIGITVNEIDSGLITFMNREFETIFGYGHDELPDIKTFINNVYRKSQDRKLISSQMDSDIKRKRPENLFWHNVEIKNKAGDKKFVSAKTIPLYDQNLMISTLQDITEQVRIEKSLENSLKEKEALLREIHHRVKNNLQTVSSLLDLQADNISDPSTLESFKSSQSRIRSMALIHERLYKSENLSGIKAREYIHSLTEYLEGTYIPNSTEITLLNEVDNFLLNLDLAIPCGLIITELVSNSMKYAFNKRSKGTISIALKILKEDKLLLSVKDDGVGIPNIEMRNNSQTLGLQLVEMFVQQIKGTTNFSSNGGTTVTIIFPKPAFVHILEDGK